MHIVPLAARFSAGTNFPKTEEKDKEVPEPTETLEVYRALADVERAVASLNRIVRDEPERGAYRDSVLGRTQMIRKRIEVVESYYESH